MAVLFAAVARGRTVLAQHASSAGNFSSVTEKALSKIMEQKQHQKLTFSHESFLIHYICQDKIICLCVTDTDPEKSQVFCFLGQMKKCFQMTYGSQAQMVLPRDVERDFSSTIATLMKNYSNYLSLDRLREMQMQMEELKEIMVHNIDLLAQRGEKLDVLIDKTDNLAFSAVTFKTTSHNLARVLWMRNVKLTVVAVLVAITVVYLSASAACGGPSWPSCVAKK
uniref:Vesicle-associated membrane protein 7 n=1 Tax=Scleropages formosus TaxID=113540 RepID=A0A8C9TTQ2_SCLFO